MKRLLNQLASLKLAVILLVLLLVGLSAGTIIESSRGAPVAQRTVYYAWWFLALQGALRGERRRVDRCRSALGQAAHRLRHHARLADR